MHNPNSKSMKTWGSEVSFQIHPLSHQLSRCLHGEGLQPHAAKHAALGNAAVTQHTSTQQALLGAALQARGRSAAPH